ncbi:MULTISPECIES: protease inhibitor I42 family protein [unclassified Streptomyces]|uniref:protease inhibitor I42 family protein n=1 Tax=unclassified Streptomyces TaxID=2593676 RepID=UPI0013A6CA6E|nr:MULTISPECIES: protease inhibitor I42 family protein [unclassified Streptomyces]
MEVREVALAPGEPYELRLTGRGARGYVWTWQVTGDSDAVSVAEGPPLPAPARPPLPGAPVERVYVVRARADGRARIRFAQVRPPYPQEAPYDEFVLDVVVAAPGK